MQLVTKTLEKVFEKFPLYSQDGKPIDEKKVLCKYFTPWGANTWIVTEASRNEEKPGDWDFFGVVTLGYEWEWGYFSLSELQGIRGQFGLGVERERYGIDPGKKTVYEVLKAEGNGGAEFAEEMLEWSRKDETEPEPETTQDAPEVQPEPEPEEVQPEPMPRPIEANPAPIVIESNDPEPGPDPCPVLPEDWPEVVLENYEYSPELANKIYDENEPRIFKKIKDDLYNRTKRNGWGISAENMTILARNFIKGVQDNDPRRVCWSVDYLEDCNYHTANRNFFEGKATEYIQDAPQYRKHMELIGGIPEHNIYWFLDGDRVLVQDENMNLLTARLDLRNGAPNILMERENLRCVWPYWDDGDGNGPTWRKPSEMIKYFMEDQYTEQAAAEIVKYFAKELELADQNAEKIRKAMDAPDPEQPAAPVIRIVTESAAPFAVLVDD